MFERHTDRARRAIFFARYEASRLGSPRIEAEHLLLGLVREDKPLTAHFLRSWESLESIRRQIEQHAPAREIAQHDRIRLDVGRGISKGDVVRAGFQVHGNRLPHDREVVIEDGNSGLGGLILILRPQGGTRQDDKNRGELKFAYHV